MPNYIQINSVTGTPPYTVSVCDQTYTYCYLVTGSTSLPTPYLFMVPAPLTDVTDIILQIVDSLGCTYFVALSCGEYYGKEFEDFHVFLFQDDSIFLFEGPP
jgi:hypothetical protein